MADINSINVSNTDYVLSGVNTIISCSTAVSTQAKTATAPKGFILDSGISFLIKFTNGNTHATPTLNLTPDGGTALGAKSLVGLSTNNLTANVIYTCYYDGTQFKIDNNCTSHISNTSNPHSVTKAQVGLGSVVNKGMDTSSSISSENYVQNKVATGIANGIICSTATATASKTVSLTGFTLFDGATVRVLFKNGNTASNPTLNINSTGAKKIVVCNKNKLYYPTLHTGFWDDASTSGTATSRMWDNFISFELMYLNGNQTVYNPSTDTATTENGVWVIMGNPTVNSYYSANGGYTVYANGLIEQWGWYYTSTALSTITYAGTSYKNSVLFPVEFTHIPAMSCTCKRDSQGEMSYSEWIFPSTPICYTRYRGKSYDFDTPWIAKGY